jgi:hypothetical protein
MKNHGTRNPVNQPACSEFPKPFMNRPLKKLHLPIELLNRTIWRAAGINGGKYPVMHRSSRFNMSQ